MEKEDTLNIEINICGKAKSGHANIARLIANLCSQMGYDVSFDERIKDFEPLDQELKKLPKIKAFIGVVDKSDKIPQPIHIKAKNAANVGAPEVTNQYDYFSNTPPIAPGNGFWQSPSIFAVPVVGETIVSENEEQYDPMDDFLPPQAP